MSQELETNQQNTTQNSSSQPPRKNNTVLYWGVIAVLLIACIYLFVTKRQAVQQNVTTTEERDEAVQSRDTLESDYNAALARLDVLVSKNAQLDSTVNSRESEVARLKSQIQTILGNSRANASDLARARSLIAQLNSKVKSYEQRIAELEGENTQLTQYNETVTKERDSTVEKNIALAQKVRLGAVLHASNIRMVPIDLRRNGRKEKETERASRVDVFRVSFDIDENRIAEDGVKDLYLRITGPNGNLLSNAAYGSGVTGTYDGQPLNYTLAKQISLKQGQSVSNVTVDWHQDSNYDRGTYQIEIFNDGYKIGGGSITLR